MTDQSLVAVIDQFRQSLSADIEGAVEAGVRKGNMPEYLRTADACAATGLRPRSLKHLRSTGQISFRKVGGVCLYNTVELFAEIDALNIPAKTNGTTTHP